MSAERTCEGCKWFQRRHGFGTVDECGNLKGRQVTTHSARAYFGDCGPSGRYWEPREKGDE